MIENRFLARRSGVGGLLARMASVPNFDRMQAQTIREMSAYDFASMSFSVRIFAFLTLVSGIRIAGETNPRTGPENRRRTALSALPR